MRLRQQRYWFTSVLLLVSVLTGCAFDVTGPTYTKESVVETLKQYGVTAHYPISQGSGSLLSKAQGERHLLQIDFIDHYEVPNGWVEVYLYPDAQSAYQDALQIRKDFEDRFRFDAKVAKLQNRTLERAPLPLFQHGNVMLFGVGVSDNPETLQRITQTFGDLKLETPQSYS